MSLVAAKKKINAYMFNEFDLDDEKPVDQSDGTSSSSSSCRCCLKHKIQKVM
jgi:hypothetical protein